MTKEQSDLLGVPLNLRAVLKFVITMHGELFVMTALVSKMLMWLVDSLDSVIQVCV